jgi:hypothetical protein
MEKGSEKFYQSEIYSILSDKIMEVFDKIKLIDQKLIYDIYSAKRIY